MKTHLQIFLLTIFIFFSSSPICLSDEQNRSVAFSCARWDNLKTSGLHYRNGNDYLPIAIPFMTRSKMGKLDNMEAFELYTMVENEDNEKIYTLVGKSRIPSDTNQVLFFLEEKISNSNLPISIFGMSDSLASFPPNSFKFFNFTQSPLTVSFANTIKPILPESNKIFKFNVSSEGAFLPFLVKDKKGKTIYETRLVGQPAGRSMVFIRKPQRENSRVSVKFLSETISIPTEDE